MKNETILSQSSLLLLKSITSLFDTNVDTISILANTSAILNEFLPNINWVGFYLFKNDKLILGPFQGSVACMEIPLDKGVCGFAASRKESIIVDDVELFASHIACDARSKSEIVIPIVIKDKLFGVLDVDSPIKSRFNDSDRILLESVIDIIKNKLK